MNKKYELTNEIILFNGKTTLYRIRALANFNNVRKGDLGGYVESEENLSSSGWCWLYENSKVYENAKVSGNAKIFKHAKIFGNAKVFGNAEIHGCVEVYGDARILEHAKVYGDAEIFGNSKIYGCAEIFDDVEIYGTSDISNNAKIFGRVSINSHVISNNAFISSNRDIMRIDRLGINSKVIEFYRTKYDNKLYIYVICDDFKGNINKFKEYIKMKYLNEKELQEYLLAIKLAKLHFIY